MPIIQDIYRRYSKEELKSILSNLYSEQRLSIYEIAERIQMSKSSVHRALIQFGINTRNAGQKIGEDKILDNKGYYLVRCPEHYRARKNGFVFEHILIAEKKMGRQMLKHEVVHHLDFNPKNNNPENLQVMTRGEHSRLHRLLKNNKKDAKTGKFIKVS